MRIPYFTRYFIVGFFLLLAQFSFAQNEKIDVRGTIVDDNGSTVIGATIKEKGTSNGVVSDFDGNFQISVNPQSTLIVTYVGSETKEISVNGKTNIKVVLSEDRKLLDEVVVVGYGTQKKANLTGSVASVSSKDLADIPTANATNLLQGRLPGVTLTSSGGLAGGDTPEIRIRGIGTFGNNEPMVLIDGVEASVSQIQQIAASDIDNVSVLKDAA